MSASPQTIAVQQLAQIGPDARVIIFHPDFRQQHLVLNQILAEPKTAYVRLESPSMTAAQAETQLQDALALYGAAGPGDLDSLVLDECDRLSQDQLAAFLPPLVLNQLRGRLYLLTRRVPQVLLDHPELRELTYFVPNDEKLMMVSFARRQPGSTVLLEVRALGPGHVKLNGIPVDHWDGVLPRSLFLYLVDRGMTTRQDIFETFWPNLSTREATNVFHVTKRKINEVLGLDLTEYWSGFYHISTSIQLNYDAALFTTMVQDSAVVPNEEAIMLLRRAISLYRTGFLTGVDMAWAVKRREELRQTYGEALVALAKGLERHGELEQALGLYLRARITSPHREDLALNIMRLYRELDLLHDALRVYERLEGELKGKLNVSPAPHVQLFADSIRDDLAGKPDGPQS